jgi:hypothetical protein
VDLPEARRCGGATLGGRVGYVCDEVAAMVDGGAVRASPVVGCGGGGVGEVGCTMEFIYYVIEGHNAHRWRPIDDSNVGQHY